MALHSVLHALGDPTRREILDLLKKGPMPSTEIADHFPISAPAITKHLNGLKEAELVRCKKEGKYQIYTLSASVLEEVLIWITDLKEDAP